MARSASSCATMMTMPMPVLRHALIEMGRRLTDAGIAQLKAEMATWKAFATGVSKVLFTT